MSESLPIWEVLEIEIGPWKWVWMPDGDDPGEGKITWWRWRGPEHPDDWDMIGGLGEQATRAEWDSFVWGATQ